MLARAASGFGSCSTTASTAAMVGFAVTVPVGLVGAAVRWLLHVECSPLERRTLRRASYVACWLPRVAHSSATVYARADAHKQTHAIVALQRCGTYEPAVVYGCSAVRRHTDHGCGQQCSGCAAGAACQTCIAQ